jgi:hypothetical protein
VGVSAYQTGCIWRMGQQDLSSRRGHDRPFTQRRSLFGTSREGTTLVAQARAAFAFAHPCSARHGSSPPTAIHGIGQSIGGLEGQDATIEHIVDLRQFASTLAEFLLALHRIDLAGGPAPGPHNFYRDGSLEIYDAQTRQAIRELAGMIDRDAVTSVWDKMARPTRLAAWRCQCRKLAGHERPIECCHRFRVFGGGRSCL